MAKKIEIYTSPFCGYCHRAKELLRSKGVEFEEIDVFSVSGAREEMTERAGGNSSVPQIFADGAYVGDSDTLQLFEEDGILDAKLGIGAAE